MKARHQGRYSRIFIKSSSFKKYPKIHKIYIKSNQFSDKMKLKVEKSENYDWAIIVDETDLRRLEETIKLSLDSQNNDIIKIKYKIRCSDGSNIETNDLNEVINEENSKERSIKNIKIIVDNQNFSKNIDISLGDQGFLKSNTVSYSITGDNRDWVYLSASKIDERLKTLKQWYSIFKKIDCFWFIFIFVVIVFTYILSLPKKENTYTTFLEFLKGYSIIIAILIIIYLIYKSIKSCYNYLFPLTVFRISAGIKRHDAIIDLRSKIFWGGFVALIVSIISGLFFYTII